MAYVGKILVAGPGIDLSLLRPLREAGNDIVARPKPLTPVELADELRDAVALMHGGEEMVSRAALEQASRLKVVAFLGIGYLTYVDVEAAADRGIRVTSTPRRRPDSVAEFTVLRIGGATRQLHHIEGTSTSRWSDGSEPPDILGEYRIGIVGLGLIGTRIAEILRVGFNSEVAYYSRTRKPDEESRLGIGFMGLHELAAWCDVLVIMTPGDDSTRDMIDDGVFAAMRPGSILMNTARAMIVDPAALERALAEGRLAAAVFDGDYYDHRLHHSIRPRFKDQLFFTPHVASQTRASMRLMVVESIQKALNGEPDQNAVFG